MKRFGRLAMLWAVCLVISLLGIGAMAEQDAASDREARDSLAYAVAGTQESDSSLALDQAKIEEKFGEGAMLRIADQGVYGEGLTAGEGVVLLSADGEERYVLVDNGEGIALWAGVFGGRTDVAPQAILYYETQEEADLEEADVSARMTASVMENIIAGRSTFQGAFMTGDMTAKGNFKVLRMLDEIFIFE